MRAGTLTYEELGGDRHRHSDGTVHAHPHEGPHAHDEHTCGQRIQRAGVADFGLALSVTPSAVHGEDEEAADSQECMGLR